MNFFDRLKLDIQQLQQCAHKLVQDLTINAQVLSDVEQLEQIVRSRPDRLPEILKYAKSLIVADNNGHGTGRTEARQARDVDAAAEELLREPTVVGTGGRAPGVNTEARRDDCTYVDGSQAGGPVRAAIGAASWADNAQAAGGCLEGTDMDNSPLEELQLNLEPELETLKLGDEVLPGLERGLQLADLQRPFWEPGSHGLMPAADASPDLGVASALGADTQQGPATCAPASKCVGAATSGGIAISTLEQGLLLADLQRPLADADRAVLLGVVELDVTANAPDAVTDLKENTDAEMQAQAEAQATSEAVEAGLARAQEWAPPASGLADEDAMMEDAEYHTPRSHEDDVQQPDMSPLSPQQLQEALRPEKHAEQRPLQPPGQRPENQTGQRTARRRKQTPALEEQDAELEDSGVETAGHPQNTPALAVTAAAEEETEEEDSEEDEAVEGEQLDMYYYGHPARSICSNWPGTRLPEDREQWENEFRYRARVLQEDGVIKYLAEHKNTRRELLKYFLHNTSGPLSADGPGAAEDADGDGGFFVAAAAASKRTAEGGAAGGAARTGYADEGLDPEEEEYDDKAFLDELKAMEEDEHDDDVVSDGSDDEVDAAGGEETGTTAAVAAATGAAMPTAPAQGEEEDLAETAELDEPRLPRASPTAQPPAAGTCSAGGEDAGAPGGSSDQAGRRRKGAPSRRVTVPNTSASALTEECRPAEARGGGVGFSNSALPSGVREMVRELADKGAFVASSTIGQIETRYTTAVMSRLLEALDQEVARIKAEWHDSPARLKLLVRAAHWWSQARVQAASAMRDAAVSAGLVPACRTNEEMWREKLQHMEQRILAVCREVATTYANKEDQFMKDKKKYAAAVEETVHDVETLKLKLLIARKTQQEAEALQKPAAQQLQARGLPGADQPPTSGRKAKKQRDKDCKEGRAAVLDGDLDDDVSDEGEDEGDIDSEYDSSFIDDADAEELAEDAEGMEPEAGDVTGSGSRGHAKGRPGSTEGAARKQRGAGRLDEDETAKEEGEGEAEGAPRGPNEMVGLKPNQTEVLLGFQARTNDKVRKQKLLKAKQIERQRTAAGDTQGRDDGETPGSAQGAGGCNPMPGSSGFNIPEDGMEVDGRGAQPAAVAGEAVVARMEDVAAAITTDGAFGKVAGATGTSNAGAAAALAEGPVEAEAKQGDADMVDAQVELPAGPRDGVPAGSDGENEDVLVTGEVASKPGAGRTSGAKTATGPTAAETSDSILGSQAEFKSLYPQVLEVDLSVDVLLPMGSGSGTEQPAARSMYLAWQEGGRITDQLDGDRFSVSLEMRRPKQATGAGPFSPASPVITRLKLPASSLRPSVDKRLRRVAGRCLLQRGALLQVRETDSEGRSVWKPVLVLAVVRAYNTAAAVRWAELRERLPAQAAVRPAWQRQDDWTWAPADGAVGGPKPGSGSSGPVPQSSAGETNNDTVASARYGAVAEGYGDASYVTALGESGAGSSKAADGSADATPLHVRLLYLHEYVQKRDKGNLERLVTQMSVEQLLGPCSALPLVWWNQRTGQPTGCWSLIERDLGIKKIAIEMFNRVTDVRLVQQLRSLKDAEAARRKQRELKERQRQFKEAASAAVDGGIEETQPDEVVQLQIQQARQLAEEKRLQNQMAGLVARRLRRRFYADVPMASRRVGQLSQRRIIDSRFNDGQDGASGVEPKKSPGRKRRHNTGGRATNAQGGGQTSREPGDGADAEDGVQGTSGDRGDGDPDFISLLSDDEDEGDAKGENAKGKRGKNRGGSGSDAGGSKRRKLEEGSTRSMLQKQKQLQKQRQDMKKLRQKALAKKQAEGGEVKGGDEGSRPLFEGRSTPMLAACFACRLKTHQVKGLQFMWENLVDNHELSGGEAEMEAAGGCILAHSMGLGKTLSTIAFLHMFLGQGVPLSLGQDGDANGDTPTAGVDGLQNRRRALLVVPANVLFNFYSEFFLWLPESGSADEALSRLTSDKVHTLGSDDRAIEAWHGQEGSVLLMTPQKFCKLVLLDGGAKAAASKRRGRPSTALGPGPTGDVAATAAVNTGTAASAAPADGAEDPADKAKQARAQQLRAMLLEGSGLVVVDEAHDLRNPASQLYKAMTLLSTRRRLALTGYPLQNNLGEYYTMLTWVQGDLLGSQASFKREFAQVIKRGQQANATQKERMASNKRLAVLNDITEGFVNRAGPEILEKELPPKSEVVLLLDLNDRQREYYEAYLNELETLPNPSGRHKLFRDFEMLRKVMNHPRDFEELLERAVAGGSNSVIQIQDTGDGEEQVQFEVTPVQPSGGAGGAQQQHASSASADAALGEDATQRPARGPEGDTMDEDGAAAGTGANGANNSGATGGGAKGEQTLQLPLELCERLLSKIREQREAAAAKAVNRDVAASGSGTNGGAPAKEEAGDVDPLWGPLPKQVFVEKLLRICRDNNEKLVVFSQSLKVLNTVQAMLERLLKYRNGIEYFRIDGAVPPEERQRMINRFNRGELSRVFLISSKAGSVGINLTTACRMVIFDVPWNPVYNAQAIARIYRFGQTRPTFVYRLIYAATLEEVVYDMTVDKEELFNKVVDKKRVRKIDAPSAQPWLYQPPARLPPEAARRRLEDLADPSTAAAMLAAATGEAGPSNRASGSGGDAAAVPAPAGAAAANGALVDAKDYALLQLAKDPNIQGCLVNAYLHKSKLPPDPLGELTAEDLRSARQQYQAEVAGDGSRRLRRLRRMAPEADEAAIPESVPTPVAGDKATQVAAAANGCGGPQQDPALDPALQDWTAEEEAGARQLAQQQLQLPQQQRELQHDLSRNPRKTHHKRRSHPVDFTGALIAAAANARLPGLLEPKQKSKNNGRKVRNSVPAGLDVVGHVAAAAGAQPATEAALPLFPAYGVAGASAGRGADDSAHGELPAAQPQEESDPMASLRSFPRTFLKETTKAVQSAPGSVMDGPAPGEQPPPAPLLQRQRQQQTRQLQTEGSQPQLPPAAAAQQRFGMPVYAPVHMPAPAPGQAAPTPLAGPATGAQRMPPPLPASVLNPGWKQGTGTQQPQAEQAPVPQQPPGEPPATVAVAAPPLEPAQRSGSTMHDVASALRRVLQPIETAGQTVVAAMKAATAAASQRTQAPASTSAASKQRRRDDDATPKADGSKAKRARLSQQQPLQVAEAPAEALVAAARPARSHPNDGAAAQQQPRASGGSADPTGAAGAASTATGGTGDAPGGKSAAKSPRPKKQAAKTMACKDPSQTSKPEGPSPSRPALGPSSAWQAKARAAGAAAGGEDAAAAGSSAAARGQSGGRTSTGARRGAGAAGVAKGDAATRNVVQQESGQVGRQQESRRAREQPEYIDLVDDDD